MNREYLSLDAPKINNTILLRPRIVNKIESLSNNRVIILHAPPGMGKTVAVKQWLKTRSEKSAWLTLNPGLNCSSFLKQELYTALSALKPDQEAGLARVESLLTNDATLEYLIAKARSFADDGEKYILVLQNASEITHEEAVQSLGQLLRNLPDNFTVLITSTIAPDRLPFTRDTIYSVGVVHARDLAFTLEEANELFVSMGKPRCKSRLRHVVQVTNGSPLSLQFFRLSMGQYVEEMRGSSQADILYIYLDNYFWPQLPQEDQDLLTKCSILYQLLPELCGHLLENPSAEEQLIRLYKDYPIFSSYEDRIYLFHPLLKTYFLQKLEESYSQEEVRALYNRAGTYYVHSRDPLFATMYFEMGGDSAAYEIALTKVFKAFPDLSIDAIQAFSSALENMGVDESFYISNSDISAYLAYASFFVGNGDLFCKYMDYLKPSSREKWPEGPVISTPFPAIGALDFRQPLYEYFADLYPSISDKSNAAFFEFPPERTFALFGTQLDQPLVHRSIHDYSIFLKGDTEQNFSKLSRSLELLFGPYITTVLILSAKAGLYYERHELQEAYDFAFRAYNLSDKTQSNKMRYSARMIIAELLFAMNATEDAEIMMGEMRNVIDSFDDMYLLANYRAYTSRKRIENGDVHAANEWLSLYAIGLTEPPFFYRTYQNFTTIRALIATESMHSAIRLAQRMVHLAHTYRRPLDEMEAELLLSIAHWYDENRKSAQDHMKAALLISQKYKYTQLFINHASDAIPILDALAKTQSLNPDEALNTQYLVNLRILVFNERGEGARSLLPNSYYPRRIKLSKRQKQVLHLLLQNASYTDIASTLGIQMSTAKSHVLELYRKLGVNSSAEATYLAKEYDLLKGYKE